MSEETVQPVEGAEQPGYETFTTKESAKDGAREITITWNVGKDINESIDIFGAEVVHSAFKKSLIIAAQANVRRMLGAVNEDGSAKYSNEDIENFIFNTYKPGVRSAREAGGGKAIEKALALLMKLPEADRKAALASLGIQL